jgi:hypothetical protein
MNALGQKHPKGEINKNSKKNLATPLVMVKTFLSYILKQTWCLSVYMCGQKLGSAWKILPVTARSLW